MAESRQTPGSWFPRFLLRKPTGTTTQVIRADGSTGHLAVANVTGLQAALDAKEPTITAGTTLQYWRGDKSWQTLNWAAIQSKPTTLSGFGITDAYPLTGNPSGFLTSSAVSGVYQPLDTDLTAIAALVTTSFGRSFLTLANMADARTAIGSGPALALTTTGSGAATYNTSTGALNVPTPTGGTVTQVATTQPSAGLAITGGPITASGTFVFALANDLAALEALSGTNTIAYRSGVDTWGNVVIGAGLSFTGGTLLATAAVPIATTTVGETGLTLLAISVRRVNVSVPGVVTTGRYIVVPNGSPAPGAGYATQDAVCTTNGTLNIGVTLPALTGSYSIGIDVFKVN